MVPPLVAYADGPDGPLPDPRTIGAVAALARPRIQLGWVVRTPEWLDDPGGGGSAGNVGEVVTWMAGYGMRRPVAAGRARAVPTRLSAVPSLLAGPARPAVAVVGGRRDGAGFRFAGGVGWGFAAAAAADAVVVEEWDDGYPLPDTPRIPGRIVEVVPRGAPADPPGDPAPDEVEVRIGQLAAALVPAGATLQWGPGTMCGAVIAQLEVPVRVLSGLVTDELVVLAARGLLEGPAESAYLWGGPALWELAGCGRLRLRPVGETHAPGRLAAVEQFVACNTALQVGLDGSVNVEQVGGRVIVGPGGHSDFAEAATRSRGGRSIIVLRASRSGRSTIVPVPEVVTTPGTDVAFVVTEHGVADLRDLDRAERARRLIAVAAPEHRPELAAAGR